MSHNFFKKGDFCLIPTDDSSIKLATAHWSILNVLTLRSLQLNALKELARVLEHNGLFYFDIPSLEGIYGYKKLTKIYNKAHPSELMGIIEREFPGGRKKKFYIYSKSEIIALLEYFGFTIIYSMDWVTKSHQARCTIVSRLNKRSLTKHFH